MNSWDFRTPTCYNSTLSIKALLIVEPTGVDCGLIFRFKTTRNSSNKFRLDIATFEEDYQKGKPEDELGLKQG